jgi:hypothetical protein
MFGNVGKFLPITHGVISHKTEVFFSTFSEKWWNMLRLADHSLPDTVGRYYSCRVA